MFVNGDDGNDDAVFSEMAAIADNKFLKFFERAGIHAHTADRNGITAECAGSREFNRMPGFNEHDFARDATDLMRERRMAEELAVLAMNRDEIFRADEIQKQLHLFLAPVTGDVNRRGTSAFVIDEDAAAEKMVDHAGDSFFISRNDARGEDDRVVFFDTEETMIVHGDARESRHRLSLAAGSENDELARIERLDVLRADDGAVGDAQLAEGVSNFRVVHHAAADKADFAASRSRDVDHLLNAVYGAGKTGNNHALRRGAE